MLLEKIYDRESQMKDFDRKKIERAVFKGLEAVHQDRTLDEIQTLSRAISDMVVYRASRSNFAKSYPSIEEIQDLVEETLHDMGERETARQYRDYRKSHEAIRQDNTRLLNVTQTIDDYINQKSWRNKENANMSYSYQGMNRETNAQANTLYWLNRVYTKAISDAHIQGDFHIHDLDAIAPYCCGWNLEDLLLKGFRGVEGRTESAPAKHFGTALGQLKNFLYTLQGEAAGAQAFSSFDTYLAPFIAYDGLSYREVKQEMQHFLHEMNVPTRVGFQSPFTNITNDLACPSTLAGQPVIIGGQYQEKHYDEFQREMNMLNQAYCELLLTGDAKGRIFSFPIPTYNISKNFDWDSPIFDLVLEVTIKYGIPYFSNFLNSDLNPEDVRSMCCRLNLKLTELRKRGGGLFGSNPLTGSIGVVTMNMARLGYTCKGDKALLKSKLHRLMNLAKSSLMTKRKVLEKNTEMGLYPYTKFYLSDIKARFGEYWKNHFNTIGTNGLNECILNFFDGKENIATPKGKAFALEIDDFMLDVLRKFQEETGYLFNLEATPAEGTGYRLAKLDKERYPDILTQGTDYPYYTNSSQLPVSFTDDIFEALDLQEELQCRYTGGTVFHGFAGERVYDIQTMKNLLRKVFTNYKIPYFTFSPTFSICPDHGYIAGEHFTCPTCNQDTEVWARVVGFFRPVKNWNEGKQEEFKDRKTFVIDESRAIEVAK